MSHPLLRNQSARVRGGYRGQVTRDGKVIAETVTVHGNRNAAVVDAWRVLLDTRTPAKAVRS